MNWVTLTVDFAWVILAISNGIMIWKQRKLRNEIRDRLDEERSLVAALELRAKEVTEMSEILTGRIVAPPNYLKN